MLKKIVAIGLIALGAAGTALAGEGPGEPHRMMKHRMHGPGLEFMAMHNIMAELLSARTGKTTAEIQALFDKGGPHAVFETLNLSEEDHQALFKEARTTLINRAASANLITAAQAEKLRQARVEMKVRRLKGPPPDHDDED